MARNRGGGGSRMSRVKAKPAPKPAASKAPVPVRPAPPPANPQASGGPVLGSVAGSIADGMAWGTGTAVAHRAVDAVMGPRVIQQQAVPSAPEAAPAQQPAAMAGKDPCSTHFKAFEDCVNANPNEIGKCQFYLDMLSECRRTAAGVM